MHPADLAAGAGAISAKVWGGIGVIGVALTDVSNPVIAVGGVAAAILAVVALLTKAWRLLSASIRTQDRQDKMLADFEGQPGRPGVMDEIASLHKAHDQLRRGQEEILAEVKKLTP